MQDCRTCPLTTSLSSHPKHSSTLPTTTTAVAIAALVSLWGGTEGLRKKERNRTSVTTRAAAALSLSRLIFAPTSSRSTFRIGRASVSFPVVASGFTRHSISTCTEGSTQGRGHLCVLTLSAPRPSLQQVTSRTISGPTQERDPMPASSRPAARDSQRCPA